jgi:hypothetical protein
MVLETLATRGEYPRASNVGNVISVPEPTTTLINPAAMPAPAMASAESGPTSSVYIASGAGHNLRLTPVPTISVEPGSGTGYVAHDAARGGSR